MTDFITNIVAVLAIFAGLSGILAISETISLENYQRNEEQSGQLNDNDSELNINQNRSDDIIGNAINIDKSNGAILASEITTTDAYSHFNQNTILSSQYLQSIKNSHTESERAPPSSI